MFTGDDSGKFLYYHGFNSMHPYITGASAAWHRSCFDIFGPITQSTTVEDAVIPFRGALLGSVILINKPLINYRIHAGSISNPLNQNYWNSLKHLKSIKYQVINACNQRLLDLDTAKSFIPYNISTRLEETHNKVICSLKLDILNISERTEVIEMSLIQKLFFLFTPLKDKQRSFLHRLRIFLISFLFFRKILVKKKHDRIPFTSSDQVRIIRIKNLVDPDTGLLMYL
jgi:hypothetical protein